MKDLHAAYLAHLVRTRHQGDYYQYVTKKPGECVVVVDYKMNLEFGKRIRGTDMGSMVYLYMDFM